MLIHFNISSFIVNRLKTVAFELNKASPGGEGYDADCVTQINTKGASEDHISIAEAVKHGSNEIRASKFCGRSLQNGTITGTVRLNDNTNSTPQWPLFFYLWL